MRRRLGFTLIELLVVIAIIAILIGLLVPAVQKVREAASRATCQNNLKQIGLACHNYESTYKKLPPGVGDLGVGASSPPSILALVLPFLEQANLYNLFNFSQDINSAAVNDAARRQEVPVFVCPSDGGGAVINYGAGPYGRCNYYGNIGTTSNPRSTDVAKVGIFNYLADAAGKVTSRVRITDIGDGTSNTAMFAETTRSTVSGPGAVPTGDTYNPTNIYLLPEADAGWNDFTPMFGPLFTVTTAAALIQGPTYRCNAYDWTPTLRLSYRGLQYYRGIVEMQNYTHTVPPNYKGYDCGTTAITKVHLAARSYHTGGVNIVCADGSVRFISDGIAFPTWQAMGTRSGNDVVDGSAF